MVTRWGTARGACHESKPDGIIETLLSVWVRIKNYKIFPASHFCYESEIKPWNDGVGGEHTAWLLSGRRGHWASRGSTRPGPGAPHPRPRRRAGQARCVTLRGDGRELLSTRRASFRWRAGGTASGWAAAPSAAPSGRERGRRSVAAAVTVRAALRAAGGEAGYLLAHAHTLQGSQHRDLAFPAWSEHRLECRAGVRQLGHA